MTEETQTQTTETQTTQTQASWLDSLPADIKDSLSGDHFASPADLAKAYVGMKPLLGADKIPVPKDGVWDETARQKLGIPKTFAEYKYEKPQMPEGMVWDDNAAKVGLEALHKAGATPAVVQAAVNAFAQLQAANHTASTQAQAEAAGKGKAEVEKRIAALKSEWGQAYDQKSDLADRAALHAGGEELVDLLVERGLSAHPVVLKAFAKLGEGLGESVLKVGKTQGAMTPAEAMAEANRLMATEPYFKGEHPEHAETVKKVTQLFGMAHDNTTDVRTVRG